MTKLTVALIVDNDNESTGYGVADIGDYKVIIDTRTKYINGSKFIRNFNTRHDTCLRFENWQRDTANSIAHIKTYLSEHLPTELVNDDITYSVNNIPITMPDNHSTLVDIDISEETFTLDDINDSQYFISSNNLRNFTAGTYIHLCLCVYIATRLNSEPDKSLLRYITNLYNENESIAHLIDNQVVIDTLYAEHISENDPAKFTTGHIPIVYNNKVYSSIIVDDVIYVKYEDACILVDEKYITADHIISLYQLYNLIYYNDKHPLGDYIPRDKQYVYLNKLFGILPKDTVKYFTDILNHANTKSKAYISNVKPIIILDMPILPSLHERKCLYTAYIGIHANEHLFKFGITVDIARRVQEHKRAFDQFTLVDCIKSYSYDDIERDVKNVLRDKGLLRSKEINGKTYTELYAITSDKQREEVDDLVYTHCTRYTNELGALEYINELQTELIRMDDPNYVSTMDVSDFEEDRISLVSISD